MNVLGFGLALVIGLSLGLLGGGGSILTVPVLVYILHYSMQQAAPMSLMVVGVTSAVGAVNHHRAGNIRWDIALAFVPAAVLGAFAGARLSASVPSRVRMTIFAVLMLAAAVSMFFGPSLWNRGGDEVLRPRRPWWVLSGLGMLVGAITGLVGVGGGFMYVPALALLGGLAMRQAVGTSLVLIVTSCVSGLLGYAGMVAFDWPAIAEFTALAVVGVLAGSRLVARVSPTGLRRGFAVLLVIIGLAVLIRPR